LSIVPIAHAQEGYPMDGTWRGEWGEANGEKTMVVIVLGWNGAELEGTINPGRNALSVENAVLDPDSWRLQLEATGKDGKKIVVNGILDNIGAYNRNVVGTWEVDGVEYPFRMARE